MYLAATALVAFSLLLYWVYKKIRAAPYTPGLVASALEKNSDDFDDESLHNKESPTRDCWFFPNDVEVFYFPPKRVSKERSPVLALHGGPAIAPANPWKISEDIPNLYLYHARGCGRSSRPLDVFPTPGKMWPGMKLLEQQLGIGMQIADMERIRRRLGVQKIDIVGHSFGGFIATLYAAEFPQHVRSLTLLVPAALLTMPSKDGDLFQIVETKLKERGNEQYVHEFKSFMKEYLDFGSLPNQTEDTLAVRQAGFAKHYYRAVGNGTDLPHGKSSVDPTMVGGMTCYATFLSLGMEHDYVPALKNCFLNSHFPVAIVHGTNDIIPESTSLKYAELFPAGQAEFFTVEGDHDLFDVKDVSKIVEKTIALASTDQQ